MLIGERSGAAYKIGDSVEVTLTRADPETRQIDFILAQGAKKPGRPAIEKQKPGARVLRKRQNRQYRKPRK